MKKQKDQISYVLLISNLEIDYYNRDDVDETQAISNVRM
ncbi:hypothetical protein CoNPh26_CDS0039 [Staphylococcus phage S-CoN_Ph26]|nr:hypothetical protein CoNPh26_CDS0039 [Staphylococcus phage S-CoN_Ph26]